ncbi:hypothetical protein [Polyangium sp. 15x6]|uniref:immunity protein Imm33 domain-containing protein n=1 Tax=Polyangium sp. 15x6 TaxID=3042687 RepID=UPI00249A53B1|nr:hypothetical protein [Polyangium sp. 15x6]MDI3287788.1 hypothetical protein [Polyangium sp. 15x6]
MEIIHEGTSVRTKGLARLGARELCAHVSTPELASEAEAFLRHIATYLEATGASLQHGETFAYGYWLTKFMGIDGLLEAWEYKADATDFVPGVTLTVTYWRDQHRICDLQNAEFHPPRPDRLTVISAGVLEGDPDIQGVRYPSPEHMSGWWLTTNRFDGDTKSLRTMHTHHVTAARPDLAALIALPYGFRFDLEHGQDIWFDERVATSDVMSPRRDGPT